MKFILTDRAAASRFPEIGDLLSLSDEEPQFLFEDSCTSHDLAGSVKLKFHSGLLKAKLALFFLILHHARLFCYWTLQESDGATNLYYLPPTE